MDDLLQTALRCPHCRASVRPSAPWCTLCHADLRPAPEPVLQPAAQRVDPLTAPAALLGLPPRAADRVRPGAEPTWPCGTCGVSNPFAADACAGCGAGFLAGLRETEGPLLELPGVGDLTRMSRGQRLAIAGSVALAVALVVLLLGLLVS